MESIFLQALEMTGFVLVFLAGFIVLTTTLVWLNEKLFLLIDKTTASQSKAKVLKGIVIIALVSVLAYIEALIFLFFS